MAYYITETSDCVHLNNKLFHSTLFLSFQSKYKYIKLNLLSCTYYDFNEGM